MNRRIKRRSFLKRTTLTGAGFCVVGGSLLAKGQSPNEKLNIGVVGVAGRGGGNMGAVAGENIVALCDVNQRNLAGAASRFAQAKTYHDWRKMLDQKDLDAVVCGTTEHTHASAIVWSLRRDLGCWALDLGIATSVEADSQPKGGYPEVYPEWLSIRWEYPAAGDRPPVTVYWHDGGKMTENIMTGIVSCRVKQELQWDSENLQATNCAEADQFIRKQYREGWSLT